MARRARDLNMDVAGQLYDMARIHDSPHGRIAYKRAAQAVLRVEEPSTSSYEPTSAEKLLDWAKRRAGSKRRR